MADSGKVVLLVSTDPIKLERCIRKSVDENINPVKGIDKLLLSILTLQLKNIEIELLNL
jgi:hypothetical protein